MKRKAGTGSIRRNKSGTFSARIVHPDGRARPIPGPFPTYAAADAALCEARSKGLGKRAERKPRVKVRKTSEVCKTCGRGPDEVSIRQHSTECAECYNKRYRDYRLAEFERTIQTVDVVFPINPPVQVEDAYFLFAGVTQRAPEIHDNGAVGLIAEGDRIRFRLYQGKRPSFQTDSPNNELKWSPLKVAQLGALSGATVKFGRTIHTLGEMEVQRLKPTRCLRILSVHKHHEQKTPQNELIRRRLIAGGVLCIVAEDGDKIKMRTGSAASGNKDYARCSALRVFTDTERAGLIAQMRPLGGSGRYGGGMAIALDEDHDFAISTVGLRKLKSVTEELGVDAHTIQFTMRKLGYDWLHSGHGRWFDDRIVERLRQAIPAVKRRATDGRWCSRWDDREKRLLLDAIEGRRSLADVVLLTGRTRGAVKNAAWHMCKRMKLPTVTVPFGRVSEAARELTGKSKELTDDQMEILWDAIMGRKSFSAVVLELDLPADVVFAKAAEASMQMAGGF